MPLNEARFLNKVVTDEDQKKNKLMQRMAQDPSNETQTSQPQVDKVSAEVAKVAIDSGDAETLLEQKLNKKQKKEVKEVITAVGNQEKPKQPTSSVSSQFTKALLAFTPQLVGAAIGGIFEGGEGALAGAEQGAKAGQVLQQMDAAEAANVKAAQSQVNKEREFKLKEDELRIKEQVAKGKSRSEEVLNNLRKSQTSKINKEIKNLGKLPGISEKLSKISGEDKKKLGSLMTADRSLTDMVKTIESGENLFEVIGESKYTDARNRFVESIARLQSGAAISDKEFDIYTGFTPSSVEVRAVIEEKMKRNRLFISDRLNLFQLSRKELGLPSPITLQSKDELVSRREELLAKRGE